MCTNSTCLAHHVLPGRPHVHLSTAQGELTTHILAGDGEGGPRFHHPSIHNHTYNDGVTGVEDTVGKDTQPAGEHGNVLVLLTLLLS